MQQTQRYMARTSANRSPGGELRIIAGNWRSRKLRFPDVGGVRPTPARTRETLFNWLAHQVPGSHCLDLFSGSGALGLEALSRGAASATLVEHNQALANALQHNLGLLGTGAAEVICRPVERYLEQQASRPFDLVFMDPPFRQGWLEYLLPQLISGGWIAGGGWVYAEYESEKAAPVVPSDWQLYRKKTAGQVAYCVFQVDKENPAEAGSGANQGQAMGRRE